MSSTNRYDPASGTFREVSPLKRRLFDALYDEADEELDSIGDLSERTVTRLSTSIDHLADSLRRESFSSIASLGARQQFSTALNNLQEDLIGFSGKTRSAMDSPSDLSPNAPPAGFEDPSTYFAHMQGQAIPPASNADQPASTEGSVDSSGFEKVEHDVLEEYGQHFANQMQQSIFGQLPDDPDSPDDLELDSSGFLLVDFDRNTLRRMNPGEIQTLHRIPGEIDKPYPNPEERNDMSSPRDDVIEHSYGPGADGLIEIPHNESPPPVARHDDHHQQRPADDDLLGDFNDRASPVPAYNERAVDSPPNVPESPARHHDLLDDEPINFDQQAQALVDDAVHQAQHVHDYDHLAQAPIEDAPAPPSQFAEKLDDEIAQKVEDVHDEVDDVLERMQENDHFQEMVTDRPSHGRRSPYDSSDRDLSDSEQPDFRSQTPEETVYERHGPLTIPELPERVDHNDDLLDFDQGDVPPPPYNSGHHHGFETVPRPPTPPKDISDEEVQPSLVNLGHGQHHQVHHDPHHSILKHSQPRGGEPWFTFKTVDPTILELIYWRDPKKSAIALSLTLLALFIFAKYPILSVISYTGLAVLAGTLGFRVFKAVEAQIKKTGGENPFQEYLAQDLTLPQERVHAQVDVLVEHGTLMANQVKKLVFVESIVDTVKFGLLLWSLTYIASWFSGLALVILAVIGVFSLPKVYETYQEPIDAHLAVIKGHVDNVTQLLEDKLPFLKRAQVEVEKKDQ